MRLMRIRFLPGVVLAGFLLGTCSLGAAQRTPETPTDRDSAKCVGSEACQMCHEDSFASFAESAHAKTLENERPAERGCEACHGPGADHVAAAGNPAKIRRFAGADAETVRSRCMVCHKEMSRDAHREGHVSCLSCHSAHHYTEKKFLLTASKEELCRKCHR
jgi:predicted CXXCH cytochrome family protein